MVRKRFKMEQIQIQDGTDTDSRWFRHRFMMVQIQIQDGADTDSTTI